MKVKTELLLTGVAALYIVLTFPFALMLLTAVVSGAVFVFYDSLTCVLGALAIIIVARFLTVLLKPEPLSNLPGFGSLTEGFKRKKQGFQNNNNNNNNNNNTNEGFQPRDPVSIHQRIVNDKAQGPLKPKVQEVTGVLESAKILDSLQIANLNKAESGGSSSTLPASLSGIPPIRTPREEEIIKNTFNDLGPRGNPFLQNGADDSSINTALSSRGADLKMDHKAGDVAGITIGNGTV